MNPEDHDIPLCVDCDGTLIRTDLLHESVFRLIKVAWWRVLLLPLWLLGGKAQVKTCIAKSVDFDWATVPVDERVLSLVRGARGAGRRTVLATASPTRWAQGLAAHLGCFDEVIATDGRSNMSGRMKRTALVGRFGERGFDYVGNSRGDLHVWSAARKGIVVSSAAGLIATVRRATIVEEVLLNVKAGPAAYLRSVRVHQWLKNLLVFVPLLAAHRITDAQGLQRAALAFLSFSLCAAAVYVLNDLLDLESDRRHVHKRTRPFAAALIPVWHGAVGVVCLLGAAFMLASLLPLKFIGLLSAYFGSTLVYSIWLKRQVVVDILLLAGMYTLRVMAGGAATDIIPSFWLLAFSMFLFLSLAMVKRYSELREALLHSNQGAAGRGYVVDDLPVLMSAGTSSGMVAVLVFALYINNPDTRVNYAEPLWLWLVPPLLLYWVTRLWLKTQRGQVQEDPVLFVLRDWQSLSVLILSVVFFMFGA